MSEHAQLFEFRPYPGQLPDNVTDYQVLSRHSGDVLGVICIPLGVNEWLLVPNEGKNVVWSADALQEICDFMKTITK